MSTPPGVGGSAHQIFKGSVAPLTGVVGFFKSTDDAQSGIAGSSTNVQGVERDLTVKHLVGPEGALGEVKVRRSKMKYAPP